MMIPGASNGTYAEYTKETFTFTGYSTTTGEKVWGPTTAFTNPLAYYDQTSAVCAYGKLYTWSFGGEVVCIDMTTGAKSLELEHWRHRSKHTIRCQPTLDHRQL